MSELDELLDGALEDFRDDTSRLDRQDVDSTAKVATKDLAASTAQEAQPHHRNNELSCQPPDSSAKGETAGRFSGPVLPPRPPRGSQAKGNKLTGPDRKPSAVTSDLSATVKALADFNSSVSSTPVAGPAMSPKPATTVEASSSKPSDSSGTPAATDPDALLQELTAQLEQAGGNPSDPGAMDVFVDGLLQQLLSKQVLHQSMKDIGARYPAWLDQHRDSLNPDDLARYTQQHQHIIDICQLYETRPDDFGAVYDKLQQMQSCGTPPEEIVNELSPGLTFDNDGLPQLPGRGCPIQ